MLWMLRGSRPITFTVINVISVVVEITQREQSGLNFKDRIN